MWSQTRPYSSAARSVQAGVIPPITFGRVAQRVVGPARVDPLGREGDVEPVADAQPDACSSSGTSCSRVVPG